MIKYSACATVLCACLFAPLAKAGSWSLNIGHHNPPGASVGANFLYFADNNLAVEIGVGWIGAETIDTDQDADKEHSGPNTSEDCETNSKQDKCKDSVAFGLSGDINAKWIFSSGKVRPYLQLGEGLGARVLAGKKFDTGAGLGGWFGGLGLLLGSPKFYVYGAGNLNQAKTFFAQAGIGFGL